MGALFTDEELDKPWQILIQKLTPRALEIFSQEVDSFAYEFLYAINECESPIEQLFAMALQSYELKCNFMADSGCFVVYPQHTIRISNKNFRVDFLICAIYQGKKYEIVIECDGHEFHEKTKKQAARDRQRDRLLTNNGYKVLRFTGSEIYKNPYVCARDALGAIFPRYRS